MSISDRGRKLRVISGLAVLCSLRECLCSSEMEMRVLGDKGSWCCNCYSQNKLNTETSKTKIWILGAHPSEGEWQDKYRHFHKEWKREITMHYCRMGNGKVRVRKHTPHLGYTVVLKIQNHDEHGALHGACCPLPAVTAGFHGHRVGGGPVSWDGDQAAPLRRVVRLDPRRRVCDLLGHHLSCRQQNPMTSVPNTFTGSQSLLASNNAKNVSTKH